MCRIGALNYFYNMSFEQDDSLFQAKIVCKSIGLVKSLALLRNPEGVTYNWPQAEI